MHYWSIAGFVLKSINHSDISLFLLFVQHRYYACSTRISFENHKRNELGNSGLYSRISNLLVSNPTVDIFFICYRRRPTCFFSGYQTLTTVCVKEHNQQQQIVADKRCHGLDKPEPQVLRCNVKPCEAQ